MTTIGYARVSTDGQTLAAQTEALHGAGCARIFAEKISGAYSDRPQLAKAIAALAEGDTLIVCKLDRLARSTRDLLNTLAAIADAGASFKSLGDPWCDTTSAHGRLALLSGANVRALGGLNDDKQLGAYCTASLVDPTTRDACHASTSLGLYLMLCRIRRNLGPVPVTRSRSTVLTDSFKCSATSSCVRSGCISDCQLRQATLPARIFQGCAGRGQQITGRKWGSYFPLLRNRATALRTVSSLTPSF
jgi:hypothetical protein